MRRIWLCAGLFLAAVSAANLAEAQLAEPPGALGLEDTGTIEQAESELVKVRDSKDQIWLLQINSESRVSVEGTARPTYLKPGVQVEFIAAIDKKGAFQGAVAEITIDETSAKRTMGMFDDLSPTAKPLRTLVAGEFLFRGKVTTFRNGQLAVSAGSLKVNGMLDDNATIHVKLDDPAVARTGDEVKFKGWYYEVGKPIAQMNRPGQAVVEEITITLTDPVTAAPKRR